MPASRMGLAGYMDKALTRLPNYYLISGMDKRIKDYPQAIEMYQQGMSIQEVAEFYGVTRQSMHIWLNRRGVKMRPKIRNGKENHFYRDGENYHKNANRAVERAVKKGILIRPSVCETCKKEVAAKNNRPQIEAHHCDYNKPLEVMWLCRECHFEWHENNQAVPFKQ